MSAVIECRSTVEIHTDVMFTTLSELEEELKRWSCVVYPKPRRFLHGENREDALRLKEAIEASILEGYVMDANQIVRDHLRIINAAYV